jgi:DegV family protein with EDD domain
MRLTFGARTYLDGLDLSTSDFYRMLRDSREIPTTSAPSPSSFLEAFRRAAKEAEAALCLTVSSKFSACFNSAMTAMEEANDALPGFQVSVLDTETAAGGEGLVAVEAWRTAAGGGGLAEVLARARSVIPRVRLLAMVDTLHYLWKSGRVPAIAKAGASLLRIKPIFELVQGDIHTVARPRTHQRAVRKLVELMRERAEPGRLHATVMHADAADAAEELKRQVEAELSCEELYISEFTPVMGAHIGPRLLGVAFRSD